MPWYYNAAQAILLHYQPVQQTTWPPTIPASSHQTASSSISVTGQTVEATSWVTEPQRTLIPPWHPLLWVSLLLLTTFHTCLLSWTHPSSLTKLLPLLYCMARIPSWLNWMSSMPFTFVQFPWLIMNFLVLNGRANFMIFAYPLACALHLTSLTVWLMPLNGYCSSITISIPYQSFKLCQYHSDYHLLGI